MMTPIALWANLPSFLKVFLLAMVPLTELRASIPVGLLIYKMPVWAVFLWSVLANILVIFFVFFFLRWLADMLQERSVFFRRFFAWWFGKVEKKFVGAYERWGLVALTLLVAIPLPGTGAWTGVTAAYLFKIDFKKAFGAIALGVIMAGVLVTLASRGVFNFVNFI